MHPRELPQRITAAPDAPLAEWWVIHRPAGPVVEVRIGDPSWDAGARALDAAVDSGAGVVLLVDDGAPSTHARAVTAIYCGSDASAVMPADLDDVHWMRECAAVRDAMPGLRALVTEPGGMLGADAALACATSIIGHAAARQTPVVIAGAIPHIAALCAQRISTASSSWVHWGLASDDPAALVARTRLAREPWMRSTVTLSTTAMLDILRGVVAELDARRPEDVRS